MSKTTEVWLAEIEKMQNYINLLEDTMIAKAEFDSWLDQDGCYMGPTEYQYDDYMFSVMCDSIRHEGY